jgi:phosphoenolpyruvate synthase/pyruvate phosphate dikinase
VRDPGSHVLWLEECGAEAAPLVGGKAVGLGHLVRQGHLVPAGFAVSTAAYREALAVGGRPVTVGERLAAEITGAYRRLGGDPGVPVAVRSSATAEDTAEASFAGQQDTYLWVRGATQVVEHVSRCWASLFTDRAVAYRARLGVPDDEIAMGVVVQAMVPAEAAGVLLTLDPLTGDRSQVTIEAAYGLGTAVVEVAELAALGKRVEQALGVPQDIEWAVGPGPEGGRELWLLQARPETVWSRKTAKPVASATDPMASIVATLVSPLHTRGSSDTPGP